MTVSVKMSDHLGSSVILTSALDLKQRLKSARTAVKQGEESLESLERYVHQTIVSQYNQRYTTPTLEHFLANEGHHLFLQCLKRRERPLTVTSAGITLLVPSDGAILGERTLRRPPSYLLLIYC